MAEHSPLLCSVLPQLPSPAFLPSPQLDQTNRSILIQVAQQNPLANPLSLIRPHPAQVEEGALFGPAQDSRTHLLLCAGGLREEEVHR
jgi:hypothetical protein